MRLHGRNVATWNVKGATAASDRFNYDYTDGEQKSLAAEIGRLVHMVKNTHVVFNNNMEDQGQRNARTMAGLLGVAQPSHVDGAELGALNSDPSR